MAGKRRDRTGRNDPCPCGSGKKYKKCCLAESTHLPRKFRIATPTEARRMRSRFEEIRRKEESRTQAFGRIRPAVHCDHMGYKFVAVGNELRWAKNWKTFIDFLGDYLKFVFGKEWWLSECSKVPEERHQVVQWERTMGMEQHNVPRLPSGLIPVPPTGSTLCYLLLAYDLYVLQHHSALQAMLVKRLKNKDQFQGARYELIVTSTCIRAGFDITFEDETNRASRHPEFLARCRTTGAEIAVEAKSRVRPGLLGQPGKRRADEDVNLRIGRLINDALDKQADLPYVIFVDVNMPPSGHALFKGRWFEQLLKTLDRPIGHAGQGDCFNALVFTNFCHHYAGRNQLAPRGEFYIVVGKDPIHPISPPRVLSRICDAVGKFGRVPNTFEEAE